MSSGIDFDDAAGLIAADARGDLRSAALAGAQVRAVASLAADGALAEVAGGAYRSVVVVLGAGPARAAAELVSAVLADGDELDQPLMLADRLPGWVGALDLVVVCGFDGGDPALAGAVGGAVRRGATTVVAVPWEGPVAEAGAGRALSIAPRRHVPDRFGFAGMAAALLAVLGTVGRGTEATAATLHEMADRLDAEAVRGHPERDLVANPAKRIAARLTGRRVALSADTGGGRAVARHAASQALTLAGEVITAVGVTQLALAAPALAEAPAAGALAEPVDPLFHDPFLDPPVGREPVRVLVLTDPRRRAATIGALAALADVDPLMVDDDSDDDSDGDLPSPPPQRWGPRCTALLVLVVRLDFAMIYRRLSREQ